jgi:hypothetical protein
VASSVDICNLALAHLGDDATVSSINPPEGSAQAEHCARFYPIARDTALEAHSWNFATKRATLALVTGAAPEGWEYAYALPADCLSSSSVMNVWMEGASDNTPGEQFVVETTTSNGTLIYTNAESAVVRYTARIIDTTKFSPMFVNAVSWLLSSYLAGPVVKGDAGMKIGEGMFKMYLNEVAKAAASDANSRKYEPQHRPDWVAMRGLNPRLADGRIIR